jgi:hypothetical protein
MSVDLITWETLKTIDFIKRLDGMLVGQEQMNDAFKAFEPHLEKIKDDDLKNAIEVPGEILTAFMQLQREQIIWIYAMIEGMKEIESRQDAIEKGE